MSDFLSRWPMNSGPSITANSPHFQRRWVEYYEAIAGRPPRDTLLMALELFSTELSARRRRTAVDLGCGEGRDTVEILRQNWRVIAVDGEPEAIARLRRRSDINRTYLETRVQRFEELTLPPDVDLVNASFCLPFCPPAAFAQLWEEIVTALRPGGRFCGHLFGDRDSWSAYCDISFHTRPQLEQLLAPFEIELLDEEDQPGKTALGDEKHWHLYNIVVRKR
ncbi:class I SAM-dependent methyltransferase [Leptolyngbya sp. Heron Island J]|uniref:class I SAM-dependent methyltransferase n=1 Tax=Leptolyngbya sp. Heron Island J TaxID=1385935 RepID=UPI001F2DBF7B|nr:class I SAM-dependent methyltransferase [Leptolyngbya sp. Heron Island J]